MLDRSLQELLGDALFVIRAGVGDVPARLHKIHQKIRHVSIVSFRNAWHIHDRGHQNRQIQLRPVGHKADFNVTVFISTAYSCFERRRPDASSSCGANGSET
jgi:hypothetical protein